MTAHDEKTLRSLIEGWLAAERLELDDLELSGHGRARTLRVTIDGATDLDLDLIGEVSEGLSRMLDAESDLEGPYQLEVSSPGLERKLKTPRHFEKSVGRIVRLKVREGESNRTMEGTLESAGDDGFVIEADGTRQGFAYVDVVSAKTVFRWEKAPRPGKKENA